MTARVLVLSHGSLEFARQMATNYLDYRGYCLRMHDGQMVFVFALMIEEGRKAYTDRSEILEALESWYRKFDLWVGGVSDIDLKGIWQTSEGQQILLTLLDNVQASLAEFGETVPAQLLARLTCNANVVVDQKADFIREGLEKIRDFVREPETNGRPILT